MTARGPESRFESGPDEDEDPELPEEEREQNERGVSPEEGAEATTLDEEVETGPPPLPLDAIFEILKNERRRIILQYLMDQEGSVELGELAEHVAIQENDISASSLTSTERKRAYVGLYQCHLPKMDELGAVTFNRDRGIIELGPNIEQLEPYIDGPDDPDPWPRYYLALATANATLFVGLLVTGTVVAGGALTGLLAAAVGGLSILSFGGLALVHHNRRAEEESGSDAAQE